MKKRTFWIGAALGVALIAATAALNGNAGATDIEIKGPPPDHECICPANWAPVVCTSPDAPRQAFSNACVAGCYGYTDCARIVVAP